MTTFFTLAGNSGPCRFRLLLLPAALFLLPLLSTPLAAEVPDHSLFSQVLRDHVRNGVVDYRGIKADERFPRYIAMLQQTNPAALGDRRERLAFWLNAYNAFTIQYVIDRYPIKSLMNKLAYATGGGTFKTKFITIHGVKYSLNDIENDIIRPMGDPRIHFALVCGAKSCPPLRSEAYLADRLDEQLDEQGRIFLSQVDKNRIDLVANEIHLSKIFDWFKDDFRQAGGSELDFIAKFLPAESAQQLRARAATLKIKYTEYDWSLNE